MKQVYMNRELSWLKFNERVLEEAEKEKLPLCERLLFASIFQTNLDEFFMVRVGSLVDQALFQPDYKENKTDMTPMEQIDKILAEVKILEEKKEQIYSRLMELTAEQGIRILKFKDLGSDSEKNLELFFQKEIMPLISPTIISRRQPFPFLKNFEIYVAVLLETKNKKERLGVIPCTGNVFERLVPIVGEEGAYMLVEELILHYVAKIFKGYKIKSKTLFRVTRNADIDADVLYDDDLDYREFMADLIKRRKKLAPIRLELSRDMDEKGVQILCKYLDLDKKYVIRTDTPLDLSFVFQIQDMLRKNPDLFYPKRIPQKSVLFNEKEPIMDQISEQDRLLSFPYESMKPFLKMLSEAATDEDVVSIKMTLYRVARHSEVIAALTEAAENGKEVVVLVELRARFDEENNIEWSRRLEDAGCQVIYGLDGLKVHSKLCLITKKSGHHIEYITQIGTGNYNEKTSRLYTDLSLMTANVEIGLEATNVFRALCMGDTVENSNLLMVAPHCLQNKVLDKIDEEIEKAAMGEDAYVGIKLNSLTDKKIIDKLIEASCAGVKIEMVIRGICCLIPGIPGKTENIRVISIVGRFLEHSRIYIFGRDENMEMYISSADFMTRNTTRRVEVAAPILDPKLKKRIMYGFQTMLKDNQQARELGTDGIYRPVQDGKEPLNSQERFYEIAYHEYEPEISDICND